MNERKGVLDVDGIRRHHHSPFDSMDQMVVQRKKAAASTIHTDISTPRSSRLVVSGSGQTEMLQPAMTWMDNVK
jgi:hypothetical protein